ncbi:MAG: cob(I)yrinic acid a,c-diamide adenosyltransferase [Candidatus Pacebacteria bacterium]|nr:cob(I)yrinic acid a,c-diamide adenosyltransferase [Candidatus Paceibacterota bacterium]
MKQRPAWKNAKTKTGLVHVYTGDGKGKTSAGIGLLTRAAGQDLKCCLIQFMKGKYPYGEIKSLKKLGKIDIKQFGKLEFIRKGEAKEIDKKEAEKATKEAKKVVCSGKYDLVVLDEICVSEFMGLVNVQKILDIIKDKSDRTELVLTGRKANKKIFSKADYITFFENKKHPFKKGILARKGIEF